MECRKSNNFDAVRLAAALLVLVVHMESISGRPDTFTPGGHPVGILAVMAFFAISGYLVTGSWRADPDLGRFLAKRFLRIVPGLAVAMPLTYFAAEALGLSGFPNNRFRALNGSLWTIPIEVQCYVLLALLMMMLRHASPIFAILCLIGLRNAQENYTALFGLAFAIGCTLRDYPVLMRWIWVICGLGVAIFPMMPSIALVLLIAPTTVWIGTKSWPGLRSVGATGDISYGVYIYAFPVQQMVVALMGGATPYITLLVLTLAIVIPTAWLSWAYIEATAISKKPIARTRDGAAASQAELT